MSFYAALGRAKAGHITVAGSGTNTNQQNAQVANFLVNFCYPELQRQKKGKNVTMNDLKAFALTVRLFYYWLCF